MATHINKRVVRRETDVREAFGKYRGRNLVVELLPSNEIRFKIKGTRQGFTMHIAQAYAMAKFVECESRYNARMELYKQRAIKRKPKRPVYYTAKRYLNVLFG